jgi:peptidoglycan/xylan/chitin deacetylase (PgdA/CDA1 family)
MLIAVNFHYIRPSFVSRFEAIHGVTPEQFERQIQTLARLGNFVSGDDIRRAVAGQRDLPARAIVLTLDDGLREQFELAWPILSRLGVPAMFFINTEPIVGRRILTVHKIHILRSEVAPDAFLAMLRRHADAAGIPLEHDIDAERARIQYEYDTPDVARLKFLLNLTLTASERAVLIDQCFAERFEGLEAQVSEQLYMDPYQIGQLARDGGVGVHGHEHLPLGMMPAVEIGGQIAPCVRYLDMMIGYRPFALSYPFGEREACSLQAAAVAAQYGIEFAFTMERAGNPNLDYPLHLGRFDCNDVPGGKRPYWPDERFFASAARASWHRASSVLS